MTELHRLPDWRERFAAFIAEIRGKPFEWKDHDCGPAFAGCHVENITGVDLTKGFRQYRTADGALRAMKRAGFDDLADLAASRLPEIHPSEAQVGDIAAFKMDSAFGHSLGIVNGERVFVLRPEGLGTMELLQADRAFRVG